MALFLRLLDSENKEDALAATLAQVRDGVAVGFEVELEAFSQVPGSPFAYWLKESIRKIFANAKRFPKLEHEGRSARQGLVTADDFRFVRLCWENIARSDNNRKRWFAFAKGGEFARFYADIYLSVDWENDGDRIRNFIDSTTKRVLSRPQNISYFFRSGLTYSARSQRGFSTRALAKGCIFSHKGIGIFVDKGSPASLLAITNSAAFTHLLTAQMAFGSYEVGVIQRTPVPNLDNPDGVQLGELALACIELKRNLDRTNEISHVFHLPALLQVEGPTLAARAAVWSARVRDTDAQLARNQAEIDEIAFRLYGIGDDDRAAIESNAGLPTADADVPGDDDESEPMDDGQQTTDNGQLIKDLVSYALGCVFGRWDIRFATGEHSTPALPDPFAPLPAYSPGMLRHDADALAALRPDDDGILADDEGNPADIVRQVRLAFDIIWGDRAEATEREIVAALGVKDLRDYFQKKGKGGFWPDHIQRYSKSRRKAPIYWLLQSPKGRYGLWLYYPRLNGDTFAKALNSYAEPKLRRELERLATLRAEVQSAEGSARRTKEREVERQEDLLNDIQEFRDRLARVIRRGLRPDHNDGVLLTIAPLWELTPWAEAKRAWGELQSGKYEWSSVSKQLRGE